MLWTALSILGDLRLPAQAYAAVSLPLDLTHCVDTGADQCPQAPLPPLPR